MTDAHPRAPDSGGPFIPRALVPVHVGRSTVNLYPIIDTSMATHERAHAYHINSLPAMDGHDRPLFEKLLWGLVTSTIFVRC